MNTGDTVRKREVHPMMKITLCGRNIAECAIVTSTAPAPAEKTAAEFLKRVIHAACGTELPIVTIDEPVPNGICIGTRGASPDVRFDGFRITTDDAHLYLDGNIPRGTLYAAYDFAEKHLGYRCFAEDCEVIPTEGEADIPAGLDTVDNPVFESRRHCWISNRNNPEFASHNRLTAYDSTPDETYGGGILGMSYACHTFNQLCPPSVYFDEHPEYFSWVIDEETGEGRHIPAGNIFHKGGQLCLTNPDVLHIVTENVLKQLREHPETHVVDISQCDNRNYCQCERCAAVDEEEGGQAGTMIRFVNAIAEVVTKEFPHVMLRTFAYLYSRQPPKLTKAHPNVIVRYCTINACFRHALGDMTCERNNGEFHFTEELTEWGRMADHLSIWNYSANYDSYITPFPNLASMRENVRLFADCGAIDVYEEDTSPAISEVNGAYGELKTYVLDKLLWDPYMSEETFRYHVNDFLKAYYGPGWLQVRKYIDLEHEATKDSHVRCFSYCDYNTTLWNLPADIREFLRGRYEPAPYQPAMDDHPLIGLVKRLDEAYALLQKAHDMAETDEQRNHIRRATFSLDYLKLFCMPHDKAKMTKEEQADYEAACEEFHAYKNSHKIFYNLTTQQHMNR